MYLYIWLWPCSLQSILQVCGLACSVEVQEVMLCDGSVRVFIITWERKLRGETRQLPVRLGQSVSEPLTAHITEFSEQWTVLSTEHHQDTSLTSPWQRRRGVQRTPPSSGRSVVSIWLGDIYVGLQSSLVTWLTVLLELTSFTALLCSPLTLGGMIVVEVEAEDINVFTLVCQA